MNKEAFHVIAVCLILICCSNSFAAPECRQIFDSRHFQTIPKMLGLTQIGYIPTKDNRVHVPANNQWFQVKYGYESRRWQFSDRFLDHTELSELYNSVDRSSNLLSFTYDTYMKRGFKNVEFDQVKFLENLSREDKNISEKNTTYFRFNIGLQTVGTAKITFGHSDSDNSIPVEQKVLKAQKIIRKKLTNQNLFEIGRLAKTTDLQIETIFSAISHHIMQRLSDEGKSPEGSIIGHAGKIQSKIYQKLGFEILASESELGTDQFIVTMPVEKFIDLFPTINGQVTYPSATTFMDEMYYLPKSLNRP